MSRPERYAHAPWRPRARPRKSVSLSPGTVAESGSPRRGVGGRLLAMGPWALHFLGVQPLKRWPPVAVALASTPSTLLTPTAMPAGTRRFRSHRATAPEEDITSGLRRGGSGDSGKLDTRDWSGKGHCAAQCLHGGVVESSVRAMSHLCMEQCVDRLDALADPSRPMGKNRGWERGEPYPLDPGR